MGTNRPPAPVIDLGVARLRRHVDEALSAARRPLLPEEPRFGAAHVEGGRVVVHCVASLTPHAAEQLAHLLYSFAAQAREDGNRG